jgi:cellulose synthase/poly-beta-1,6-N-acetylglucosamine synthase-like glycosyltransferase
MFEIWNFAFWLAFAVLAYAHAVYPLLLRLPWRRAAGDPRADRDVWPRVSVIIPTHNEDQVIEAKVANCLAIDYPRERIEFLVASDGSTDRTCEMVQRLESARMNVLEYPVRRGKAATMNDAVSVAGGDVLCFCDANVMFEPQALKRLVARLDDPHVGAVTGDVRLDSHDSNFGRGESLYYRLERAIQRGESRVGSVMGVDGGMYVLRRELFQPLPADTILDDFVATMRVIRQGRRVLYEPEAIATEGATPSARQEFARRARVAAGAVQSIKRGEWPSWRRPVEVWQYASHKLLRWLGPVWLVLVLASSVALWNAGTVYLATAAFQGAFYLLAAAATISIPFRRTRLGGIPFYFAMSHAAMAVGLVKGLFNLQRVTWQRTERGDVRVKVKVEGGHEQVSG